MSDDEVRQRLCRAMRYDGDDWLDRAEWLLDGEWRNRQKKTIYDVTTVGGRIRAARAAMGLSQEQLGIRLGGFLPQNVRIELHKLTEPPLLRLFVAEAGADFKPLERLSVVQVARGRNAPEGCGELRAQGDIPPPLVREAEELGGELASALFEVELRGFECGCFPLHKSVPRRHAAPGAE